MNTTTAPPLLVNLDQTTLSFGSNVDQIHEERGVGGEELSGQYLGCQIRWLPNRTYLHSNIPTANGR